MDIRHLTRINLNLLITLQVLLDEQSVSKTAENLYLTQPAISKSLSRLRDIFGDPLFTRSGRGLVATPFAASLKDPLASILDDVEGLFLADDFEPGTYKGEFNIAVNEFLDMALIPSLIHELSNIARGLQLKTYTQFDNQLSALEKGELDFVMSLKFTEIPAGFFSDLLIPDKPALFVRKGHPLLKKKSLVFKDLFAYPRVALNLPDMDKLSVFSGGRAAARRNFWASAFETENLITALSVISRTDYLLPGPGLLKLFASKELLIQTLPFDPGADVSIEYCLVCHERVENSKAHQWLRQQIISHARKLII